MVFDARRTQPKLNRREAWVQHLAEGNSIYVFESSNGTKIRFRQSVGWSAQLDKRWSIKLEGGR